MKLYTCTRFKWHYPTGTAAVIVARDQAHATELLNAALVEEGLLPVQAKELDYVPGSKAQAIILNNGDY